MSNVTVIKANKIIMGKKKTKKDRKIRVCAYARVSTDSLDQENSYVAQVEYYENKIRQNDEWEFVKVFADEGKSGTQTKTRTEFNEMIKMCEKGKIDMIFTKSISRFARNTVDLLENVRKLKAKKIPIIFEKENINTMDTAGEFLISILSSQAQEESRNISENVKWGIRRRFESGKVTINCLGYKTENGEVKIIEDEAKIVKYIYKQYLKGLSYNSIARILTEKGVKTKTKKDVWSDTTILMVLKNEKYTGNTILQKMYTENHLTKKYKKNDGELPKYYVEGSHKAIIPQELFTNVQEEMERRSTIRKKGNTRKRVASKYSGKYVLTELAKCGQCGKPYRRQVWSGNGEKMAVWRCECRLKNGTKSPCKTSITIKEKLLHNVILDALNEQIKGVNDAETRESFMDSIKKMAEKSDNREKIQKLEKKLVELISNGSENIDEKCMEINNEILKLKAEQEMHERTNMDKAELNEILKIYSNKKLKVTEFDNEMVGRVINSIKIYANNSMKIEFKTGDTVVKNIENE